MKHVLIIGASGGIGNALKNAYQKSGDDVTTWARSTDGFDITSEASISEFFAKQNKMFDEIIVATGALEIAGNAPEKSLSQLSAEALLTQYHLNAIGPALVLKHARRAMPRDRHAVFAALSARVGSIGDNQLGGWYAYRAAKAGLNQLIHSGAIEMARTHPKAVCICFHPGTVATSFTEKYLGRHPAVAPQEAAQNLRKVIDARQAADTGKFYDWQGLEVPW